MKVKLDPGAFPPSRGHPDDAGADICAMYNQDIAPRGNIVCLTGVHVEIPKGHCGILVSKSGLNMREDLTTTGLIDAGYSGQIKVKVYNNGTHIRHVYAGQKISQLVIVPCVIDEIEIVDDIYSGDRGAKGFGSTGKF